MVAEGVLKIQRFSKDHIRVKNKFGIHWFIWLWYIYFSYLYICVIYVEDCLLYQHYNVESLW